MSVWTLRNNLSLLVERALTYLSTIYTNALMEMKIVTLFLHKDHNIQMS